MLELPVYLDYSATTPVDPRVVDRMVPYLREKFGNPASRSHAFGWAAEEAVEHAREQVAGLVNADPREIVWTSGATESINLALKGAAQFYKERGRHLVTIRTEHKATLDTMRELERQGFEVTYLDVEEDGLVDLAKFEAALRPDTILASVMFVNNEIGVIQNIPAMGELLRGRGIIFHVDAAQATGKLPIDLAKLKADMESPEVKQVIADNHALGQSLSINGTPAFIIDTNVTPGYLPAADLKAAIDAVRAGGGCKLC